MQIRKRHFRNTLLIMTSLALLTLAASALAQAPAPRGNRDGKPGPRLLAEKLDLSEEQIQKIEQVREEGRAERVELRKQQMRLRNELNGEMLADEPARKKVLALNEKLGAVRTKMQARRLTEQLAVRELLTPPQRDHMLLMKAHGKRGRRGHPDGGVRGSRGSRVSEAGPHGPRARGGGHPARSECPQVED